MTTRSKRARVRAGIAGFSMIELLVTIVVAGVVFGAIVPVFANALKATAGDQMRVVAQNIAQQKMEQIRQLQFDQIPKLTDGTENLSTWMNGAFATTVTSYTGSSGKTFHVAYTVTFNPANASATQAQNAEVTVDVWWDAPPAPVKHAILKTVISRQFSGPGVQKMTLSPLNGIGQLDGAPTVVTVYIAAQDAGANNSGIGSVTVTVADQTNGAFTPVTLTAAPQANGVYTASWDQAGAAANDTYVFTAQAISPNQNPGNPYVKNAKLITGQNPNPVTNFVIAKGNGRLLLTWDNSTALDFNHYELYRGTVSGSETLLLNNLLASGCIDTGLTNGTTYYYKVRVVDNDGNPSTFVSASNSPAVQADVTAPGAPGSFTATRNNDTAVLTWVVPADTGGTLAGYFIYRDGGTQPYARFAPGGAVGSVVTYTDKIGWADQHTYSVVAFDAVGLTSTSTTTLTVIAGTPPVFNLTVTTNKASGVSINVVQSDAQPDPLDCGTKPATNLAAATWTSLPYGTYHITATYNGVQNSQDVTFIQNTTVAMNF